MKEFACVKQCGQVLSVSEQDKNVVCPLCKTSQRNPYFNAPQIVRCSSGCGQRLGPPPGNPNRIQCPKCSTIQANPFKIENNPATGRSSIAKETQKMLDIDPTTIMGTSTKKKKKKKVYCSVAECGQRLGPPPGNPNRIQCPKCNTIQVNPFKSVETPEQQIIVQQMPENLSDDFKTLVSTPKQQVSQCANGCGQLIAPPPGNPNKIQCPKCNAVQLNPFNGIESGKSANFMDDLPQATEIDEQFSCMGGCGTTLTSPPSKPEYVICPTCNKSQPNPLIGQYTRRAPFTCKNRNCNQSIQPPLGLQLHELGCPSCGLIQQNPYAPPTVSGAMNADGTFYCKAGCGQKLLPPDDDEVALISCTKCLATQQNPNHKLLARSKCVNPHCASDLSPTPHPQAPMILCGRCRTKQNNPWFNTLALGYDCKGNCGHRFRKPDTAIQPLRLLCPICKRYQVNVFNHELLPVDSDVDISKYPKVVAEDRRLIPVGPLGEYSELFLKRSKAKSFSTMLSIFGLFLVVISSAGVIGFTILDYDDESDSTSVGGTRVKDVVWIAGLLLYLSGYLFSMFALLFVTNASGQKAQQTWNKRALYPLTNFVLLFFFMRILVVKDNACFKNEEGELKSNTGFNFLETMMYGKLIGDMFCSLVTPFFIDGKDAVEFGLDVIPTMHHFAQLVVNSGITFLCLVFNLPWLMLVGGVKSCISSEEKEEEDDDVTMEEIYADIDLSSVIGTIAYGLSRVYNVTAELECEFHIPEHTEESYRQKTNGCVFIFLMGSLLCNFYIKSLIFRCFQKPLQYEQRYFDIITDGEGRYLETD